MKTLAYVLIQDDQGGEVRIPINARLRIDCQDGTQGLAAAAMAAESVTTARTPAPEAAPKRVHRMWPQEVRDLALRLIERGETISSVAAMLGASYNTVWQWTYATSRVSRVKPQVSVRSESTTVTMG